MSEEAVIHLICTQPNRYSSFSEKLPSVERTGNLIIYRIEVPQHGNKYFSQLLSFFYYQKEVWNIIRNIQLSFIFVSTSKLFTGYLAYKISKSRKIRYYLDLRDLFAENLNELIKIPILNGIISRFIQIFFEKPTLCHARHININSEGFRKNIPVGFKGSVSFFPNGIDDEFNSWRQDPNLNSSKKVVCYAGNIGEGQGLDKIIPALAKALEATHHFIIIGEGSSKNKLINQINNLHLTNVELIPAMKRAGILAYYKKAHYLFLHLNDYRSFEKVLPSKIFEYGSGNIPILAGVKGYARVFIENELIENVFIFNPCDVHAAKNILLNQAYRLVERTTFVNTFNRKAITGKMSDSIIHVLNQSNAQS